MVFHMLWKHYLLLISKTALNLNKYFFIKPKIFSFRFPRCPGDDLHRLRFLDDLLAQVWLQRYWLYTIFGGSRGTVVNFGQGIFSYGSWKNKVKNQ